MYLVSTGSSTILNEFANLETNFIYRHANRESTDFQFYAQQRIFVEVNKKSGLEILRIKQTSHPNMEIQRVRKLTIENVYCVACAKQSSVEMALGLYNGQVKLYNYRTSEFVYKFNAENIRNSVLYMDYNASDEYLSSVFENGQINIYGIKTRTRIDSLNIDGNSTLARFHPIKRFHLAIASYKGSVTIYDIHSKRRIFHNTDSHAAPCRDLCMSLATPDTLISVGYDCLVNIFDTRRKTQPLQLQYSHPLSTVAISECGNFCCVGNLKGELITYDLRSPKIFLSSKKVHDCAVTRISFVPADCHRASSFVSNATNPPNCSNAELTQAAAQLSKPSTANLADMDKKPRAQRDSFCEFLGSATKSAGIVDSNIFRTHSGDDTRRSLGDLGMRGQRDSFCDFLDFQSNKDWEKMSTRFVPPCESYDCSDALQRKPSIEDRRFSVGTLGISSMNSFPNSVNNSASADSFEGKISVKRPIDSGASSGQPLRDCSNNNLVHIYKKLVQIEEEQPLHNSSTGSDKENPATEMEVTNRLQSLPGDWNSTPNRGDRSSDAVQKATDNATSDVCKVVADLRTEMSLRFQHLESEIKFQLEVNKWQIFTQNFNLWSNQCDNHETICDALGILLQTDPFANEFVRLRQENENLKLQLQNIGKR